MARTDDTAPVTETVADVTAPADATETATDVTETTDTATETTNGEATEASTETATDAATDDAAKAAEAAALAEAEKHFETFKDLLSAAIASRDEATGDIPKEQTEALSGAFRALTPANKKAAKLLVKEGMNDALRKDMDAPKAKAFMDLGELLSNTRGDSGSGVAKETVDPTTAYIEARLAHYFASEFIVAPADLKDGWADTMKALVPTLKEKVDAVKAYQKAKAAWDATDTHADGETEPALGDDIPAVLRNALKIAQGGSARTRTPRASGTGSARAPRAASAFTGARRSIPKHVAEWAASVPVGTIAKHGEVARFVSAEYPAGDASSGAVTAFMDRGNFDQVTGVTIASAPTADGKKGIKRVA